MNCSKKACFERLLIEMHKFMTATWIFVRFRVHSFVRSYRARCWFIVVAYCWDGKGSVAIVFEIIFCNVFCFIFLDALAESFFSIEFNCSDYFFNSVFYETIERKETMWYFRSFFFLQYSQLSEEELNSFRWFKWLDVKRKEAALEIEGSARSVWTSSWQHS